MKIAIVIPAFNPDPASLHDVVTRCREVAPEADIFIVDDGSIPFIANHLPGIVNIIHHETNRGKGAALRTALDHLVANGIQFAITMDADGQHLPEFIPQFLTKQQETDADLVIGNRLSTSLQGMPWDRRFSNTVSTKLLEWLFHSKLYDAQSGYRLINVTRWRELSCDMNGFEFEPQLLLQAIKHRWKTVAVPIPVRYGDESSHIHRLRDTLRFIGMVGREFVNRQ